jgi:hypothetical protein
MTNYLELLYLISFTGLLAVAYSYLLSGQILSSSPGNARMQEIAEAIQIGAKAYLNRQYKTIAVVGVIVLAIVTYFFSYLVGIGYFIGAFLCLNFFSKFLPAPEYPDFESIVISFVFIKSFFIKGINGICIDVE